MTNLFDNDPIFHNIEQQAQSATPADLHSLAETMRAKADSFDGGLLGATHVALGVAVDQAMTGFPGGLAAKQIATRYGVKAAGQYFRIPGNSGDTIHN